MARRILSTQLALLCLLSFPQVTFADPPAEETEWGDLTGRLIYDGVPPEARKFVPKKGFPPIFDESLVVDPKTHGIANLFIYVRASRDDDEPLPVHPSYEDQIKKPVTWTIKPTGYTPHVMLLHTKQKLIVKDVGGVTSNPKGFLEPVFGMLIPPMMPMEFQFPQEERLPKTVGCNIHPWFSGYLLVKDDPYVAVTDAKGKFIIKNLPVGEHEFQFWQERSGYVVLPPIHLRGQELVGNREKGRLIIDIKPGDNDLGIIKIDPQVFD